MPSQGVGGDVKVLCGPGEGESGSVKLGFGDDFFVEVSFAEDQEVPCCVVVRRGVARDMGLRSS